MIATNYHSFICVLMEALGLAEVNNSGITTISGKLTVN